MEGWRITSSTRGWGRKLTDKTDRGTKTRRVGGKAKGSVAEKVIENEGWKEQVITEGFSLFILTGKEDICL